MRKRIWLILAAFFALVLAACGAPAGEQSESPAGNEVQQPFALEQNAPAQSETVETPPAEVTIGSQTFSTDVEELVLDIQMQSNDVLDLSPLKWCGFLRNLVVNLTVTPNVSFDEAGNTVVSGMAPVDLSPLAELSCVEELRLNAGAVEDLAPLSEMSALRDLSLVVEGAVDLAPLANCAKLRELSLEGCGSVDLAPLTHCAELSYLRLWISDENGETPDLSALSGTPKLETLVIAGHNGLSELKDLPLRRVQDIGDSDSILQELPNVDTLETVQISDRYLTDISPLLENTSVTQILLNVYDQEDLPQMTTITADTPELLDSLVTGIPKEQLRSFLERDGASVTIIFDFNRTSGFMG